MAISSLQDVKSRKMWTAVFSEFFGTMILVLVACGSGGRFPIPDGNGSLGNDSDAETASPAAFPLKYPPQDVVQISLSAGLTVGTIIWISAHVSGGHINPGVTIGFVATRKISLLRGLLFIIGQTLGAVIGAVLLMLVTPSGVNDGLGTLSPGRGVTLGQAFVVEMFITFFLVWTVFASCDNQRNMNGSGPLSIGLSVVACHLWALPYTGSGMNPARAFGPAVVSGGMNFTVHWLYWIGPLMGGAMAGLLYDFVYATNASPTKFGGFFAMDYDDDNFDSQGRKPANPGTIQFGMRRTA